MGQVDSASAVVIDAPMEQVFALVADLERVPEWQPDATRVEVLARDAEGRAHRIRLDLQTAIRSTSCVLRLTYDEPRSISWVMEDGDVKQFDGGWTLTEAPGGTRAEYAVTIDFGRGFGLLVRGPAGRKLAGAATSSMPKRLKAFVEADRLR